MVLLMAVKKVEKRVWRMVEPTVLLTAGKLVEQKVEMSDEKWALLTDIERVAERDLQRVD